jgi:predicted transcriptional regulator
MRGGKGMVGMYYLWQKIRTMRENRQGIKTIARILKLSGNAVKKYLRSAEPPVFQKRK